MEYIYAALTIHKAGQKITEDVVKKVLQAAGAKVDDARVKALIAALDGVDIEKAIKETAVSVAVPVGTKTEVSIEKKKEVPKEEKKSEEQAAAGLGALFG